MKGRQAAALQDGSSRVYHYEVSGAGRVDYRYNPKCKTSPDGDEHAVVYVISIDLSSH